ncbi:hypothetical protein BD413DRAFT_607852 [Trametes elegans]|nr:hypothetical protein BD413DRAFT_607852 [Trametes elegans]
MGQYWQILDLDAREVIGGHGDKLGVFFWSSDYDDLLGSLKLSASDERFDTLLGGIIAEQASPLLQRLQVEIFDLVVDDVTDVDDGLWLLFLAITCKAILARVRGRILAWQQEHRKDTRRGHRLICVGDYAETATLPPRMLSAEELLEIAQLGGEDPELDASNTLFSYAYERYRSGSPRPWRFMRQKSAREHIQEMRYDHAEGCPRAPWAAADFVLLDALVMPWFPQDRPWVLCNVSKREYVRERDAEELCVKLACARDSDEFAPVPSLWHFLLAYICWSDDYSVAIALNRELAEELTQGRWAGDRFARTLLDRIEEQGEGPWTDVTKEASAFVEKLWSACSY